MPPADYPRAGARVSRLLAFLILILGTWVADAQTLTQVRNTGPRERRMNIVFVAEGFTAAQEAEFNRQVTSMTNSFLADEGYARFANYLNVFRVFVPSNQAGLDDRDRGVVRDTYFNSYLLGGLLYVDDIARYQGLLAEQVPDYDLAILLVNLEDSTAGLQGFAYRGSGLSVVATRPTSLDVAGLVALHESGHAFAVLIDEYFSAATGTPPTVNGLNVSNESARDRVAWSRFILPETPTPTTDFWFGYAGADAIGTFPGGGLRSDLFRAASLSRMQTVTAPWGAVNLRAIASAMHRLNLELATAPPSIVRQPAGATVALGQVLTLTVEATGTGPITYQWMRDGRYVQNGHRAIFTLAAMSNQDAGVYSVEVTNSAGTTTSVPVTVTTTDGPAGRWDAQDIGGVGLNGNTVDWSTTKVVRGSGAGIAGTADEFQFAYQTLTGDGTITARLTTLWLGRSTAGGQAGVMIRESLEPGARNASLLYVPNQGQSFLYRQIAADRTRPAALNSELTWGWLRIVRSGDTLTAYVGADGGTWLQMNPVTIPGLPATMYVGLAVSSADDSLMLSAEFRAISVTRTAPGTISAPTGLSAAVTGTSQISLAWTDTSSNETGFEVERAFGSSTGTSSFARIATLGANATSYVDTAVAASTPYSYRVRATGSAGTSDYSNTANVTTPVMPPPSGSWSAGDIGAVSAAGSSSETSFGWTLSGSGADIWDRSDEFYYRYQPWSGDGEFIARVAVSSNTHSWAKAGLMIRESITAGSRHAFMCVSAGHGTSLQSRATTGGDSASTPASESGGSIRWLRLVRSGNTLTGYASMDGTTWTLAGSVTLALPANVFIGLAVTSHNDGLLCEARFDSISLRSPGAPPPPPPPLNPPGALSVSAVSSTQINLIWSDTNPDEDGVEVQRSTDGTTFATIATVGVNATNFANTGLTPNTRYTYRVRATRGADRSGFSNTGADTTFFATPVAAPSALSATADSENRITLAWTDNSGDETGFEVQRADGAEFVAIATVSANVTTFANTFLTASTTYTYRVRAVRGPDRSGFTNTATATTNAPALLAPTNLSATPVSTSRIDLNWTDPSSSEDGFRIERASAGGAFALLVNVGASVTSHADVTVAAGTSYRYRVRANYASNASAYSNEATATTPAVPPPPPPPLTAPSALSATAASSSEINLAWTDNSGNEDGFEVERSTDGTTFFGIASLGPNITSFASPGLNAATTYAYRVRAFRGAERSAYSNTSSATTAAVAVPQPISLTATAVSSNRVDLNWTDTGPGEDGFRIERAFGSSGGFAVIGTVGANVTTFADTGVAGSTLYRYRVRATAGSSFSAYSNETNVVTPEAPATEWLRADIGAVGVAGSDDMSATPATVRGSGSDIWEGADAFHFVYRALSGDGTIVARLTGITNTHAWAKAGVMIRESLAAGARNTFIFLTPGNGLAVQNRMSAGGATTSTAGPWGMSVPLWIRLTRTGNTITASRSGDGANWATVTSFTVSFGADALVGLAVTSHNNGALCTGSFTNVSVTGSTPPPPPPPPAPPAAPTTLTATATSSSAIALTWTDASSNETGFEVERSTDNVTFAAQTTTGAGVTTFADSGLTASTTYYYRTRAVNAAGASAYSNTANARTGDAPPPPPPPSPPAAPTSLSATAVSSSQINLTWTDASTNETGFEIQRSLDNATFTSVTTTGAGAVSFSNTGLTAATTYYYRVRAVNAADSSAFTNTASARTAEAPPPPPPPPPATWQTRDIGAVGRPGSVAAVEGGIALTGSGEDIWNNADEFRYYYQPMSGDGELIARVTSLTNTNGWAKAGVMFRETLDANAAHALMCVSIDHGTALQYRAATGGASASSAPTEVAGAIRWVRLVRSGNTITGYESQDGTNWTLALSRTFAFPTTIFVGLAVTSHNDTTTTTATFTNISLITGTPPPPPPVTVNAPSGLSASVASSTQVNLTWSDNSTNETGFEIERAVGTGGFSSLAAIGADRTGYSDTTVAAGTTYNYRVRALAGTVTSPYSNIVSATPTTAPPPPPPTTWSFGDIGAVGVAGSNSSTANTITVRGSGSDIWENADSFRFVYRSMTGDGVVEAQVTSMQNTNGWAKAGVMIRESLAPGSRNAFAFLTPGTHGVVAQSRQATGGVTNSVSGPMRTTPYWVRLTRSGTTFTAASSADGVTWTTYATFTIPMNATAFFGFAVTSHNNAQLNTAVFTDPFVR